VQRIGEAEQPPMLDIDFLDAMLSLFFQANIDVCSGSVDDAGTLDWSPRFRAAARHWSE
jgi:hypothetical protein